MDTKDVIFHSQVTGNGILAVLDSNFSLACMSGLRHLRPPLS
jgi:hypothetical protein